MHSLVVYSLGLILLFSPYVKLFGEVIPLIALVASWAALEVVHKAKVAINSTLFLTLFCLAVLFFVSGFFNGGVWSIRPFFLLLVFLCLFYVASYYYKFAVHQKGMELGDVLVNLVSFNSLLILFLNLGVLSPEWFYSIIYTAPRVFDYPIVRYPGLTFDAFSYISTLTALGFCFLLRYSKGGRWDIVRLLLMLCAVMMSGRAGVVVILAYLLVYFPLMVKQTPKLFFLLCLMVVSLILLDWGEFNWVKLWAFGFVLNAIEGKDVIDSSVEGVKGMMGLPLDMVFGDPISFSDVNSDLAVIRIFNSMGLLGLLGLLLYFIFFFSQAIKYRSDFLLFVSFILFILNFKDVYFVSPYGHTCFALLILFLERERYYMRKYKCLRA